MTTLLYFIDNQIARFEATLISNVKIDDEYHVLLDQTAFYPQGGGMMSDQGFLNGQPVLSVYKKKDEVYHVVKNAIETSTVVGTIDMRHRHLQAVSHSTQHLLAALFEKYLDIEIDSIEYSNGINGMDLIGIRSLDDSFIKQIEDEANLMIEKGSPIETFLEFDEKTANTIRHVNIVCCQDDNTCGCIHVNDISEIRHVKILSWETKKDWVRIHYVSGSDLLDHLQRYHDILNEQVKLLSRPIVDLNIEIQNKMATQKQTDYNYELLQKEYYTLLATSYVQQGPFIDRESLSMSTKDLQTLASCTQNVIQDEQVVVLYNKEHFILISKHSIYNAQSIFKEIKTTFDIKGGGTPSLCQGKYVYSEIDAIIQMIQAQLDIV